MNLNSKIYRLILVCTIVSVSVEDPDPNLNSMSDRAVSQLDLSYFEAEGFARDQLHPGFAKKCYLNS